MKSLGIATLILLHLLCVSGGLLAVETPPSGELNQVESNGEWTVRLPDTGAALVNPGMGWTLHFYSNVPKNYGSKLNPSDTVEDFPGLSTVYLRLPWAYLEPEEGKYNWVLQESSGSFWG